MIKDEHLSTKLYKLSIPIDNEVNMSFLDTFRWAFKILCFNEEALLKVINDPDATLYGIIILLIAGITTSIYTFSLSAILLNILYMAIIIFIGYGFFYLISSFLFEGKALAIQYFRAFSVLFAIYWIAIIPFIGSIVVFFGGIWILIANIFILQKVQKISKTKSIVLGLIPLVLFFCFFLCR